MAAPVISLEGDNADPITAPRNEGVDSEAKEAKLKKGKNVLAHKATKKRAVHRDSLSDLVKAARDINMAATKIDIEDLSSLLKDIEDSYSSQVFGSNVSLIT